MHSIDSIIERLRAAFRRGDELALLFDYDGTLTPIVDRPSAAVLDEAMRERLTELSQRPRVYTGVLSGRALADLQTRISIPLTCLVGTSGLEMVWRGRQIEHPRAAALAAQVDVLERRFAPHIRDWAESWLERKRFGLTLHFRGVAAERIAALRATAAQIVDSDASDWRRLEGPMSIEITPNVGWTKGSAVRFIGEQLQPGALVLYAGDHQNDRDAFDVVDELRGITIGVGEHAPQSAHYRLPDPSLVKSLLQRLLNELDDLT
jgi:trehalose 6-phosphate phosphatase